MNIATSYTVSRFFASDDGNSFRPPFAEPPGNSLDRTKGTPSSTAAACWGCLRPVDRFRPVYSLIELFAFFCPLISERRGSLPHPAQNRIEVPYLRLLLRPGLEAFELPASLGNRLKVQRRYDTTGGYPAAP